MLIANAARHGLSYVREREAGVTPENPAMRRLRHTSCALNLSRDSFTSEEKRQDRQISDVRTGTDKVAGSIGFEWSFGEYDELLEACFAGQWENDQLKTGTRSISFTVEREFADIGQFVRYRGCYVNKLSLSVKPNAMLTGSFDIVGLAGETAEAPLALAPLPSRTHAPYDSYLGELTEDGLPIAVITGLDVSLDNGITPQFVLFRRSAPFVSWGRSSVTGTMTAFFESIRLVRKFLDESPARLEITIGGPEDNRYTLVLPRVRYTGADVPVDADGPLSLTMPFSAVLDPQSGTNCILRRHRWLDTQAPRPLSLSPSSGAAGVNRRAFLTALFSEPVQAGRGSVTISDGAGDVRTVPVA